MKVNQHQSQPPLRLRAMLTCMGRRIALALAMLGCQVVRADDPASAPPTATFIGGETLVAELKAIEAEGAFRFTTPSGQRVITNDALVRWGNPAEAADGRLILLADGSQIAASNWAAGSDDESLRLADGTLTFTPSLFASVSLPRHMVRAVVFKLPADQRERDRLLESIRSHHANEDAVVVSGGDRLTGNLAQIDSQHVFMETDIGPMELPISGVDAIVVASPLVEPPPGTRGRTLVGLDDGSLVAVREFAREGDGLTLKLEGDVMLRGGRIDNIVSLQPLGGHVTYLSDVEPHRFVHVPYLDLQWPLGRDENVLGGRLRAGGRLFSKGLGVQSAARLVYRLEGNHTHFAALAAIDDSAGRRGSVVFRVLLTDGESWREVFASPVIRGGDQPLPIYVPLAGAKGLALVADYADRGDELDHVDWLDARLE